MTPTVQGEPLPPELLRCFESIGARPVGVEALVPADSYRPAPAAFRVLLADGRRLKARLLSSAGRAARLECILRALRHSAFPAVVARHGRVLLLEWIDGEPLDEETSRPSVTRAAGAIQAFLHAMPVPAALGPLPADVLDASAAKLEADAASLAADGIVSEAESRSVLAVARRFTPERCRAGIVHRDLCARNMVERASGEICLIDNETMALGCCEYDLARTWYRWPLPRNAREEYFRVYARTQDAAAFLKHFPFWALAVLVDSLRMRSAAPVALRSVPLDRMRALLAAVDSGTPPEQAVFQ
jgi:thiamine kinase-like enzyme